jgi:antitoxin CptB
MQNHNKFSTSQQKLILKELTYRSTHRGCKETDILVGKFAENKLTNFTPDQLDLFADFISEDDAEIYDWILNKTPCPTKYQNLIGDIRKFHDL